jgi:putative flippase GtrA
VADVAVFNLVLLGSGGGPVLARVLSSVVAITAAFVGSRCCTWADRPGATRGASTWPSSP